MANTREHRYSVCVTWNANLGSGTWGYRDYSRNYEIGAEGKAVIHGSTDPVFRGERSQWNPAELLVASLSACHKLWYLHLAAEADLHKPAHEKCFIANSVNFPVECEPEIVAAS